MRRTAVIKEQNTVKAMIRLYCNRHHKNGIPLCRECAELSNYAMKRLENCPYGIEKPACSKCSTHCYTPEMRKKIRIVMRYSGPRMIIHHPLMAINHLIRLLK